MSRSSPLAVAPIFMLCIRPGGFPELSIMEGRSAIVIHQSMNGRCW